MNERVISSRFPYLMVQIALQGHYQDVDALLDTGFDGDIIVPDSLIADDVAPDERVPWVLADGSQGQAFAYRGAVSVGPFGPFTALIITLGNEILIGRGITDRFAITLDHGQRVIVEP